MAFSETELLERIRAGERHRYAHLIDRYRDKAFSLAVRILHNREDAEEAVQDAFVRAYRALGKFEGRSTFSTWLFRIVYNVCMTRIQRDAEPDTVEYDDNAGPPADGESLNIMQAYEAKDLLEFVKRAIDAMPPKYASIITLFYLQDMTHEEICEITGLPLGTVKIHLHRARILLKTTLAKELRPQGAAA